MPTKNTAKQTRIPNLRLTLRFEKKFTFKTPSHPLLITVLTGTQQTTPTQRARYSFYVILIIQKSTQKTKQLLRLTTL